LPQSCHRFSAITPPGPLAQLKDSPGLQVEGCDGRSTGGQ
jgi:hypothetical protein